MKNIIIGTAGHVDHGKTTLIKAITGINTDRLKEEQDRGMTIDIGFASLTLPNGQQTSIIDVPGHEKFIKNMLAGAGGVDVALLVIAADESVMPQTIEHLEILSLLEINHGVIALTKIDMVDDEWMDEVTKDIRARLSNTFLSDSPIIPVSGVTGEGIPELLNELENITDIITQKDILSPFRIPIDRIFTMQGFGTIITGTLVSGTINISDAVKILPADFDSRIRQIQVHGKKTETAYAGSRVAINLAGLDVDDLSRGDVCAAPDSLDASLIADVKINLLEDTPKPLKNRSRLRFYIGTAELLGRISLLDRNELSVGESCYAQFISESPMACKKNDRFVIRSYSPMTTIGGGIIIDPLPKKHRRYDKQILTDLEIAHKGSPLELLEKEIKSYLFGVVYPNEKNDLFDLLINERKLVNVNQNRFIHTEILSGYKKKIINAINSYHEKNPLRLGINQEELHKSTIKEIDNKDFNLLIDLLVNENQIVVKNSLVKSSIFQPSLTSKQYQFAEMIKETLKRSKINVPSMKEILSDSILPQDEMKMIIELLVNNNDIIKVTDDLYFHKSIIDELKNDLRRYFSANKTINVSLFRDITNSSRKYALPLLEYFDSIRFTRRSGDDRTFNE